MKYYCMGTSLGSLIIEAKNNNQATAVLHKAVADMGIRTGACGICNQDEVSVLHIVTRHILGWRSVYMRYSESKREIKLETFDEFKLSRYFQEAVRNLDDRR